MKQVWEQDGYAVKAALHHHDILTGRYVYDFEFWYDGRMIVRAGDFSPSPGTVSCLDSHVLLEGAVMELLSFLAMEPGSVEYEEGDGSVWDNPTWQDWAKTIARDELEMIVLDYEENCDD